MPLNENRTPAASLIDEYTRECLASHVGTRINSNQVIDVLAEVMIEHGIPDYIRSDNGPEFVAKQLRKWLAKTGARTLYIELGSSWENGYCESLNSKMRDEFLNGEIFYSLKEVRVLTERWRATTTPRVHILRRATDRQRRPHGRPKLPSGMETWKAKNASHVPTPPATATRRHLPLPLRYTNNLTGTKYRAGQANPGGIHVAAIG